MLEISVIVPLYNPGKKLIKCIDSILNQSFEKFELILINDGSTDNSLQVCQTYIQRDRRIKLIDKKNEGSIASRYRGLLESSGKFIMFVDADDWIHEEMLQRLYDEAVNNNLDITVCNTYKVLGDRAIIKQKNTSEYYQQDTIYLDDNIKTKLVESYLYGHSFSASLYAKLYKRNLFKNSGKYLSNIKFLGDDLYYNLELFLKAGRVKVLSEPYYYYRAGGFTSKFMPDHFYDIVNGYDIQKEVIEEYFQERIDYMFKGISIMLLNSLLVCISNLFDSNLNSKEIEAEILRYITNVNVKEAVNNKGSLEYFDKNIINAIENKNIRFLYNLCSKKSRHKRVRKYIKTMLVNINIV